MLARGFASLDHSKFALFKEVVLIELLVNHVSLDIVNKKSNICQELSLSIRYSSQCSGNCFDMGWSITGVGDQIVIT